MRIKLERAVAFVVLHRLREEGVPFTVDMEKKFISITCNQWPQWIEELAYASV